MPRGAHPPRRWSLRSSWGELAFACLAIALLSGIPLVVPFDIRRAYDSLGLMLLTNPAGTSFRNVHYWSAQFFLVLTVAHTWDHLRRSTESRVRPGVWARIVFSVPIAGFVMLSGFLLKGDAESQQAARILSNVLEQIPLAGHLVSVALLGTEGNRQVLYVHHVASASILLWLFVVEHARMMWPRRVSVIEAFLAVSAASLFLGPSLHDGLDRVVKGPWYFLGLQEMLHWTSRPVLVVAIALAALGLLLVLPRLSDRIARASKWLLVALVAVYAGLIVTGLLFRGEAWTWGFSWGRASSGLTAHGLSAWWGPGVDQLVKGPVPVVLGRREGCLFCHAGMKGLSASHRADAVGCSSCHAGNPFSLHQPTAHAGMILVPGNLATAGRSCGTAACHPEIVERVRGSLMNTMAGIVAVDREVWSGGGRRPEGEGRRPEGEGRRPEGEGRSAEGEGRRPEGEGRRAEGGALSTGVGQPSSLAGPATDRTTKLPTVSELGRTGADSHLRQLCASCHVGGEKTEWAAVRETSRGAGCNACHLAYGADAARELARYLPSRGATFGGRPPAIHPDVSLAAIGRLHCFGCHSRSGRLSTSYEGWQETELIAAPAGAGFRTLEDGRVFAFVRADIHAEKGMECIDCHTSREAMGDGTPHARKADAVRVTCEDCHFRGDARTVTLERLDAESAKIAQLRGRAEPGARFLTTSGDPLLNTSVGPDGKAWLVTKASRRRLELRPPAPVCLEGQGHARLSCVTCHSAWAPRCTTCHTRFDAGRQGVDLLDGRPTRGEWVESGSGFSAQPPTLGARSDDTRLKPRAAPVTRVVDPFIPGMILSIDRNQEAGAAPDHVFRRLYARAFSHTISSEGRACRSCHNDPVALGYGEGKLEFVGGRWRFTPKHPPGPDGLPADAWTGFLLERSVAASTRPDARPFSIDEQKRVLTVGACLTCHEPTSRALRSAVTDWKGALGRTTSRCRVPTW